MSKSFFHFLEKLRTDPDAGAVVKEPSVVEGDRRVNIAGPPWRAPPWFEAARQLEDGAALSDVLRDALHADISARAMAAGAGSEWSCPPLSDLTVRRTDLPDWWTPNGNLMLAGPGASQVQVSATFLCPPGFETLLVLGAGVRLNRVDVGGSGGLMALGDQANLYAGVLVVTGASTIVVGERTGATFNADLDARNGGAIIVGPDGMWASGVRAVTDDGHAIRDLKTGARVNRFGGRIIIDRHVWLCRDVQLLGDCRIGADTVVGYGSIVKKSTLPPNSVCVGRPARAVRGGITWTREDTL